MLMIIKYQISISLYHACLAIYLWYSRVVRLDRKVDPGYTELGSTWSERRTYSEPAHIH
jgi:hypothetical protein